MAAAKKYLVKNGLNYPPERRAEIDDVVNDIPKESVGWLLEAGHIEETRSKLTGSRDAHTGEYDTTTQAGDDD